MKLRTNIALALLLAVLAAPAAYSSTSANQPTRQGLGDFGSRYLHLEGADATDVVSRYLKNHTQRPYGFVTENSASQNRLHPAGATSYRFITENSASQNRLVPTATPKSDISASSRSLDWISALIGATGALTLIMLALAVLRERTARLGM